MTIKTLQLAIFAVLSTFRIISFNHRNLSLEQVGKLHVGEESQKELLSAIKSKFSLTELMFLSTCNRVEFYFCSEEKFSSDFISGLLNSINPALEKDIPAIAEKAEVFEEEAAVSHLFELASSLKSLVIGEREIITQVRKAYEFCNSLGLTGDFIRLAVKQTIETAKAVFTNTAIAKNPVSVASLAYRQLKELGIKDDARIVMIGAGETNTTMANYLQKHRFANFTVFNRTLSNAEKLAEKINAKAYALSEIGTYLNGFDVLITCTGSSDPVVTSEIYKSLLSGDTNKKVIIDLALPADVDSKVIAENPVTYIDINSLKCRAEKNLQLRQHEVETCKVIIGEKLAEFREIHNERKIELAFGEIPKQVKAIKELALNEVFQKEINSLDDKSKEVLDKVLNYVEKKYNAVAMKTAKETFLSKKED
jgi:glutamyl-tRNA reductase